MEHDVFKCIVESDKCLDERIDVLGDVHRERSASLENALDGITQRTFPGVDIAFDEYKFRVRVKLDKLFDKKLGDFNDGLVEELAYIPSCMYTKVSWKDGERCRTS